MVLLHQKNGIALFTTDGTNIYTINIDEKEWWDIFYKNNKVWVDSFGRVPRTNGCINSSDFKEYLDKFKPDFKYDIEKSVELALYNVRKSLSRYVRAYTGKDLRSKNYAEFMDRITDG